MVVPRETKHQTRKKREKSAYCGKYAEKSLQKNDYAFECSQISCKSPKMAKIDVRGRNMPTSLAQNGKDQANQTRLHHNQLSSNAVKYRVNARKQRNSMPGNAICPYRQYKMAKTSKLYPIAPQLAVYNCINHSIGRKCRHGDLFCSKISLRTIK